MIFVAVAVAWAVYLVPKALEHHDESLRNRTVSTFSHTMRVLARREPVSDRATRLVPNAPAPAAGRASVPAETAAAGAPAAPVEPAPAQAAPTQAAPTQAAPSRRPQRGRAAAARRRNVLAVLVLANAGVAAAAGFGVIAWAWLGVPAGLLVAWLVACRLMVRRERSVRRTAPLRPTAAPVVVEESPASAAAVPVADSGLEAAVEGVVQIDDDTSSIPAVAGSWDPVDVPLPTYVSKPPAARRTVHTIDLDSTGVWSSGRSESDSALAREADAARRDAGGNQGERRAAGS